MIHFHILPQTSFLFFPSPGQLANLLTINVDMYLRLFFCLKEMASLWHNLKLSLLGGFSFTIVFQGYLWGYNALAVYFWLVPIYDT